MKYECEMCRKDLCEFHQDVYDGYLKRIDEDNKKLKELEIQGYTSHCACRIVWGDGECECKLAGITQR